MIYSQNAKYVQMVKPQSVGTTAVTGTADTLGYNYATVNVALDTAATSVSINTLKISERDSTSDSWADITELTAGTASGNFTAPDATGTSGTGDIVPLHIDMRGRKRYLRVSLANSSARLSNVVATLERGDVTPTSNTERGVAEAVYA